MPFQFLTVLRRLLCALPILCLMAIWGGGPAYAQLPTVAATSASDATARSDLAAKIETNLSVDWLAPTVKSVATTMTTFSQQAFEKFSGPVFHVVEYIFAIWVIQLCIRLFLGQIDIRAVAWSLSVRSGAMLIVMSLLGSGHYSSSYWNGFVVEPIQQTASISTTLLGLTGYTSTCSGTDFPSVAACIDTNLESHVKVGMAAGLMLAIVPDWPGGWHLAQLGIRIVILIAGLVVAVIYAIPLFYYAFFILDLVFDVCLITALAPFFIASFMTQYTRPWAIAAINRLLSACLAIISSSLVVAILGKVLDGAAALAGQEAGMSGVQTWQDWVVQAGSTSKQANEWLLNPTDPAYLMLIFVGIALVSLTKQARQLFGSIIGTSGGEGLGSALGSAASKAASTAALAGASYATGGAAMAAKVAGKGASSVGGATRRFAPRNFIRKAGPKEG